MLCWHTDVNLLIILLKELHFLSDRWCSSVSVQKHKCVLGPINNNNKKKIGLKGWDLKWTKICTRLVFLQFVFSSRYFTARKKTCRVKDFSVELGALLDLISLIVNFFACNSFIGII